MAGETLLQAAIDSELHAEFTAERERLGWSAVRFITEILREALPRWKAADKPRPQAAVE